MTTDQQYDHATPVDQLLAEEWALTFPDFDLPSFVRFGTDALEMAGDTSVDIRRRNAAREIGLGISARLLELIDSARARQGT